MWSSLELLVLNRNWTQNRILHQYIHVLVLNVDSASHKPVCRHHHRRRQLFCDPGTKFRVCVCVCVGWCTPRPVWSLVVCCFGIEIESIEHKIILCGDSTPVPAVSCICGGFNIEQNVFYFNFRWNLVFKCFLCACVRAWSALRPACEDHHFRFFFFFLVKNSKWKIKKWKIGNNLTDSLIAD